MSKYLRFSLPGRRYFFTLALSNRSSDLLVREIDALRVAYIRTWQEKPFFCDAFVVLPNHLHAIWTLPDNDADFSTRWRKIKTRFVRATGASGARSFSKQLKNERGVWQRRFWEHCIRDDADYHRHLAYCWSDPVRHQLAERAIDWPFSSVQRDVRNGATSVDWHAQVPPGEYGEP